MKNLTTEENSKMEYIASIVSEITGISMSDMKKATRERQIVDARRMVYTMMHKYKKSSTTLKKMGSFFSQDHATVLHLVKTCNNLIASDPNFRKQFEQIENKYLKVVVLKVPDNVFFDNSIVTTDMVSLMLLGNDRKSA